MSSKNTRRLLVTGGTGFLGAALVRKLIERGHFVKVLDNGFRSSLKALCDLSSQFEYIQADIRDPNAVLRATEGVDGVIHLAAINGTERFYKNPELVLDVGIRGILNVIDACKRSGVSDLLVASSSEVYQSPPETPTSETTPLVIPDILNPRFSYGGSKITTELLTIHDASNHLKRALIFRPHNVYGPGMGKEHVISQFVIRMQDAMTQHPDNIIPFDIQGDGSETRSFTHIHDLVHGIEVLLERGENRTVYHLGNPEEVTISSLAHMIAKRFGRELSIRKNPLQKGSTLRRCPDIQRARRLGFSPSISLEEGLPSVIDWYANKNCL